MKPAIPLLIFTILTGFWLGKGLPQGVHSWAQSDRFSIAVHYQDDLNFFNPRTHCLASEDGKVGVEFPALQYIAALLTQSMPIGFLAMFYRCLTALIFFAGFLYFLKFIQLPGSLKGMLGILLISPIGLYYAFNFLPDAAASGFLLFSFGKFEGFRRSGDAKHLLGMLVFSVLAALLKTSAGVYLLSLGTLVLAGPNLTFRKRITLLASMLLAILAIGWYDYQLFILKNKQLWSVVFMSAPNPILSLDELGSVLKNAADWLPEYGTPFQFIAFCFLAGVSVLKTRNCLRISVTRIWFMVTSIGLVLYFLLMGHQFSNHDYYFLTTFYPLLLWLFPQLLRKVLESGSFPYTLLISALLMFTVLHAGQTAEQVVKRRGELYDNGHRSVLNETAWLSRAHNYIRQAEIPDTAVFFVFYEFGPNTSLVYVQHRGMVFNFEEMRRVDDLIAGWMEKIKPEYGLLRRKWLDQLERDHPELIPFLIPDTETSEFVLLQFVYSDGS